MTSFRLCINFFAFIGCVAPFFAGVYYLAFMPNFMSKSRGTASVANTAEISQRPADLLQAHLGKESTGDREWMQLLARLADAEKNLHTERQEHNSLKWKHQSTLEDLRHEREISGSKQNRKEETLEHVLPQAVQHPKDVDFEPTHKKPLKDLKDVTWPPPDPRQLARRRLSSAQGDANFPPKQSPSLCKAGHVDPDKDLLDHVTVLPDNEDGHTLMCAIYTTAKKHPAGPTAIRDTWASRCDGFLVLSTADDPNIPAVKVPHQGSEDYSNIWQKIRSIWKYIHWAYSSHFDWFIIGGEDTFIIPSNLRAYLNSQEIADASSDGSKPVFLGHRFLLGGRTQLYNSGGAGYVLNRIALKVLVEHLDDPICDPQAVTFAEDVMIGQCLERTRGVMAYDTRDHPRLGFLPPGLLQKEKRERFHPFPPGTHLNYRNPGPNKGDWYIQYHPWGIGESYDCCSDMSVTFHYVNPETMRRLTALIWDCRDEDQSYRHKAASQTVQTIKKAPTDRDLTKMVWPPPDPTQLARQSANRSKKHSEFCEIEGLQGGGKEDRELLNSLTVLPENRDGHTLLCIVYSAGGMQLNNPGPHSTWGPHCDGYVEFPLGAAISGVPSVPYAGSTRKSDNLRRVRHIWKYVHAAYSSDYDWFLLGEDELFVIVSNLRAYLNSEEIIRASYRGSKPLFLGRRFQIPNGPLLNGGAAGYVLNRAALNVLVSHLDDPKCSPINEGASHDEHIARCLSTSAGVVPYDTRDHTRSMVAIVGSGKENRERFHPFTPSVHLTLRPAGNSKDWYVQYNSPWGLGIGYECCSERSVSFHVNRDMMMHMSALLFDCRHR